MKSHTSINDLRNWETARDSGPVFSLTDGYVWASWYDGQQPVRLGPVDAVVERMQDFIAQSEFGERLCGMRAVGRRRAVK
jgi:hypothetical protein